jgi:hypothetical protein
MPEETPQKEEAKDAEKPDLSSRVTDWILKLIMAGGSVGAGWALFKESDLPKALVSGAIAVGAGYVTALMKPVHEGNQRRLDDTGKAIDKAIDRTTNQLMVKATRFDDRYLQWQASACEMDRPDIPREPVTSDTQHKTITALLLEKVYVPLSLDSRSMLPGFRTLQPRQRQRPESPCDRLDIWQVLARIRQPGAQQLAILAWGGYGKTTLLKHVAYTYGTKQQPRHVPKLLPFLLNLRDYRHVLAQDTPPSLPELITTQHIPRLPGVDGEKVPPDWAKERLKQGAALVLLDGFDEVAKAQRPLVARWLNTQLERYPKSVFILTSRPRAYTQQAPGDRLDLATTLWVREFDQSDRQQFVQQWYSCQEYFASGKRDMPEVRQRALTAANELLHQIETRDELKALAKNPLLLNMIVTFHWRFPGAELPNRRVDLYRDICRLQLSYRPAARKLQTLLTQCDVQPILQRLALDMMQQRQERLGRSVLLKQLAIYLTQAQEQVKAVDFLEQVEEISELLVRQENEFEFAHLSFQEYLAATQIAQSRQAALLYQHFQDDWWKPTILLYAAQTDPTSLIREAIRQGATDLAYACMQETTKQIDPSLSQELLALKQTVQISRYAQLEAYLKQQRWRKADLETDRLMLATVGKEAGQSLNSEDLRSFPCEALHAIDNLWLKYSKDATGTSKFGFSVQKQIWIECGRPMDYNRNWVKFCDLVGWHKEGDWVDYDNLIFDLNAPGGAFPFVRAARWRSAIVHRLRTPPAAPAPAGPGGLFSRAETCRV